MRALGWALALLVHLALLAYAFPLAVVFGDLPYGTPDYQTHYHQVVTLLQALDGLGRLWVYDPTFLAGYPTGLVFDLDNNGLFWFVYLARGLGLATPAAFNLFALVGAAIAPLLVWLASRALGASARAQLWTLWLAVLLWHLDATSHFCRVAGMISFSVSAALCVVALACFDRLLREEARPWPLWTATAISLSLALLIHVWAFATLAAPMIALYVWRARHLRLAAHARVWALAAVALLVNAHWLAPALSQLGVITPSARVGQATPLVLLTDFLEFAVDPEATGNTVQRTLLRFLALFGAIAALTEGRRRGAPWALGGALGLGWLLLLTYAGALVPGLRETEPYRFAVPLSLWAAVIAGPWCAEHLSLRTLRAQPRWLQACALAALLALAPRALAQITDAIPELSSQPPLPGRAASYRMAPVHPSFLAVAERLKTLPGDGRVLVEWWPLAEYLAWAQERPIVGGFPDRRLPHEDANLFRRQDPARLAPSQRRAALHRYNIQYIVEAPPYDKSLTRDRTTLRPLGIVGVYRLYERAGPGSYVAAGDGQVRASLGAIEVTHAQPEPGTEAMTLRFHPAPGLVCHPDCQLEVAEVPGDGAGFVRLVGAPRLPERFVIEHGE